MQTAKEVERITDKLESLASEIYGEAALITALSAACRDGGASAETMGAALDCVYYHLNRIQLDMDLLARESHDLTLDLKLETAAE